MTQKSRFQMFLAAGVMLSLFVGGCAGSSNGDPGPLGAGLGVTLPEGSLGGTGYYLVENAYEAEFVDCTGDATILEGRSFAEGYTLATICMASGTFDVFQSGNSLSILTHQVDCSDGSSASVTGLADMSADALSGSWQSNSDAGVSASQSFSGTLSSHSFQILETRRAFTGEFAGECNITPALSASLTII